MTTYSIYGLVDPFEQRVRYIGMTKDAQKRYKQHLDPRKASQWVQDILKRGMEPLLQIIEDNIIDLAQAKEREKHWIHFYEGKNCPLENLVHNEAAHREREERAELYKHLYDEYSSYLSHEDATKLTRMSVIGYDHVGPCAWDSSYKAIVRTLKIIQERYGVDHDLNAIDAAKITFNLFGYEWKDGGDTK